MKFAGLIPLLLLAADPVILAADVPQPAVAEASLATPPASTAPAVETNPTPPVALQPANLSSEATRAKPESVTRTHEQENAPNPDVIELPKMKVQQKKRPRLTPEVMLTTEAFNQKLANEKLSSFDRNVLNRYTLPLFGTSAADRAREEYERAKKDQLATDVLHLAKVAEVADPEQAKVLREAVSKP